MQIQEIVDESGVNLPELLARVDNDPELLQEILELFKEEFPKSCLLLEDAVERRDMEQVQIAAHTLKGMLAGLSIMEASSLAMRIERMATQCASEGIPEELARLVKCVAVAQLDLDKVCRELIQ